MMQRARLKALVSVAFLAFSVAVVLTAPGAAVPPQEPQVVQAPLNPEFVAYLQVPLEQRRLLAESADGHPLGEIPPPVDLSHMRGVQIGGLTREFLPASYDLRTLGKMTAVRNQGAYGTCWAHATFGSLESALLTGETCDFSENNLVNKAGFDLGFNSGGNYYMSSAYLARWAGPASEADDPYPNPGGSPVSVTVRKHVQNVDFIPGRASATDNSNIKQYVVDHGGVYTSMRWEDGSYSSATASFYYSGSSGTNHGVTIAGWDDNYAASNFASTPPGNGAFLIKNSWGSGWGQGGYFWISYYDTKVGGSNAMFRAAQPVTNYDTVYQYDPLGWVGSLGYGVTTAWFANVFTAVGSENVRAVSFFVASPNSPYEVYVYTDPVAGNPASGALGGMKTGTLAAGGYQTVVLDSPVAVGAGHAFSAVVKLTTPGYNYPVPTEYASAGYSSAATASTGQSYFSSNGTSWTDAAAWKATYNVCVKAFTSASVTPPPPPTVTGITPNQGPTAGGTAVTITGTNFVVAGTSVTIGGAPATSVVVGSATSLTAVTPAGTVGPKNVVATTTGGSGTLAGGFTYVAAPTVTGITPNTGSTAGGTPVTITGTGFVVAGTTVTIGGAPATSVVVSSATSLTAVTPAGTAGAKNVVATTVGGSGTLAGGFTYVAVVPHAPPGDFTGDGKSDLLWRHVSGGHVWIWPMNGTTVVTQAYVGTVADMGWEVRGIFDQGADGKADVLWRHATGGGVSLWTMNGTTVTSVDMVGIVVPVYDIVGHADYTGDGKADILWRHTTNGELWLWEMNGPALVTPTKIATIDPAFRVVGSGDFNADGKADILWRHQTTGDVWIWLMNGAVPLSQTYIGAVADLDFEVAGVGDMDGDLKADVLWRHQGMGSVWVWKMNGAAIADLANVAIVGDTNYRVEGMGDYNGDGKAEVLWRHHLTGDVWMWVMNGPALVSSTWVATVPDVSYEVQHPK